VIYQLMPHATGAHRGLHGRRDRSDTPRGTRADAHKCGPGGARRQSCLGHRDRADVRFSSYRAD